MTKCRRHRPRPSGKECASSFSWQKRCSCSFRSGVSEIARLGEVGVGPTFRDRSRRKTRPFSLRHGVSRPDNLASGCFQGNLAFEFFSAEEAIGSHSIHFLYFVMSNLDSKHRRRSDPDSGVLVFKIQHQSVPGRAPRVIWAPNSEIRISKPIAP